MADDSLQNDRSLFEKWWPRRWQSDRGVRRSSGASRGLWIEMLNLMMQSPKRGYLLDANILPVKAYTVENLARDVELPVDEVRKSLAELLENRVYSVDRNGRIYCRSMVAVERLREIGKKTGKLGGNPALINQQDNSKPLRGGDNGGGYRPRQKTRDTNSKKEGDGGFIGGKRTGKAQSSAPWTLDQKRSFGHQKVAQALGDNGWEIVGAAVDGNADATRICKAKAKDIGVTWYAGKPDIGHAPGKL